MKNDGVLKSKPIANPAVVTRERVGDWVALYNPDTTDALGINAVGVAVWRLLDGRRSLGTIVDRVKCRFMDAPGTVHDDVIALKLGTLNNLTDSCSQICSCHYFCHSVLRGTPGMYTLYKLSIMYHKLVG